MQKKFPKIIALFVFVSFFAFSCAEKPAETAVDESAIEEISGSENTEETTETLPAESTPASGDAALLPVAAGPAAQALLDKAGLTEKLSGDGPFTLLLPSEAVLSGLKDVSAEVLNNHLIEGKVNIFELENGQKLTTLGGKTVAVKIDAGVLTLGGAKILQDGIPAKNGVIHRIDKVLE